MIFSDLVALAKAGYRPADVKEILKMDKVPAGNEEPAETAAEASAQPEPEKEAAAAVPTPSEDKEPNTQALQNEVEALKKQLEKAQADLRLAQQANTRTDVSQGENKKPDTTAILDDLVRSYM